jgi:hypothetical protein
MTCLECGQRVRSSHCMKCFPESRNIHGDFCAYKYFKAKKDAEDWRCICNLILEYEEWKKKEDGSGCGV